MTPFAHFTSIRTSDVFLYSAQVCGRFGMLCGNCWEPFCTPWGHLMFTLAALGGFGISSGRKGALVDCFGNGLKVFHLH